LYLYPFLPNSLHILEYDSLGQQLFAILTLALYPMSLEARKIRMNTTSLAPVPEYRLMSSTNRICRALTLTVLFTSLALQASAGTVFFDDFSDGDAQDGMPVTWTEKPNSGDYDATSGDYVFTPTTTEEFMISAVLDITLTNTSIRTQVRISEERSGAFVSARVQAAPSIGGYFGGLEYIATEAATRLILGRVNADNSFTPLGGSSLISFFDVRTEDAVLQLDVIDNELKLWVWKAGDPMPDQPQLTATDSTYSAGTMRIVNETVNNNISTFRYVHVADSHITDIPEPTTSALALAALLLISGRPKCMVTTPSTGFHPFF
jgi:hypothetical protein